MYGVPAENLKTRLDDSTNATFPATREVALLTDLIRKEVVCVCTFIDNFPRDYYTRKKTLNVSYNRKIEPHHWFRKPPAPWPENYVL